MPMLILDSGADSAREWFLVGAPETGRLFLVVRRGGDVSVRSFLPNAGWDLFEPASAVEADEARACVSGRSPDGSLAWNDVASATAIWRLFRANQQPTTNN